MFVDSDGRDHSVSVVHVVHHSPTVTPILASERSRSRADVLGADVRLDDLDDTQVGSRPSY
jgi:hypothetical protein